MNVRQHELALAGWLIDQSRKRLADAEAIAGTTKETADASVALTLVAHAIAEKQKILAASEGP